MHPMTHSNDFWSDVIIAAASANETFDEVNIITLRSHFSEMIYDKVFHMFSGAKKSATPQEILEAAIDIVANSGPYRACEQVVLTPTSTTVILDVDVIDETVIFQAMDAIWLATDTLGGGYGKIDVNDGRIMTSQDLINF